MKSILFAVVLSVSLAACAAHESASPWGTGKPAPVASAQASAAMPAGMPAPAAPTEQHAWLQQLVGRWTFTCKADMGDGSQPFHMEGTETVRSIGGRWIVAEGRSNVGGQVLQSVMSLGYQPETSTFVGTWFDSMQPQLWSYTGHLDAGQTTLSLDTTGPSFDQPGKTSKYRDTIQLTDKDHKLLTSSVQGPNGAWTTFMRAEYVRAR